jgi:glycosyltransferase involved in cell wall biosynthesis
MRELTTPPLKKALLIRLGTYFTTQAIPRTAQFLKEQGWEVDILCTDAKGEHEPIEQIDDGRVFWYRRSYTPGSIKSFLWMWICWWVHILRHLRKHKYNAVHAYNLESSFPCVLGRIFRRKRYKLIFDVRDPWGMNHANSKSLLMRAFRCMERFVAKRVDGMLLSQGVLDRTGEYFGKTVCKNTPTVQVLNVPGDDMGQSVKPITTDKVRINFSGHISYVRNARAIFELARRRPETVMIDVAGQVRDATLKAEIDELSNVTYHGYVPFEEAIALLSQANLVSVLYDTSTPIAVVASANKMFECMMMSRPSLATQGGFPGMIAEKYEVGFAVPYDDADALVALVDSLHSDPDRLVQTAARARETYLREFTWPRQRENLHALYASLTSESNVATSSYAGWKQLIGTYYRTDSGTVVDSLFIE